MVIAQMAQCRLSRSSQSQSSFTVLVKCKNCMTRFISELFADCKLETRIILMCVAVGRWITDLPSFRLGFKIIFCSIVTYFAENVRFVNVVCTFCLTLLLMSKLLYKTRVTNCSFEQLPN